MPYIPFFALANFPIGETVIVWAVGRHYVGTVIKHGRKRLTVRYRTGASERTATIVPGGFWTDRHGVEHGYRLVWLHTLDNVRALAEAGVTVYDHRTPADLANPVKRG